MLLMNVLAVIGGISAVAILVGIVLDILKARSAQ